MNILQSKKQRNKDFGYKTSMNDINIRNVLNILLGNWKKYVH